MAWVFQDESTDYSDSILHYVRKESAIVPPLWCLEVANVLLVAIRKSRIDGDGALTFLEALSRLPIRIATITNDEYLSNIFSLADTNQLTSYDATYLYLATRERRPLATLDSSLRTVARRLKLPKI